MNPKPEKVETWEERKRGWEKQLMRASEASPLEDANPKPYTYYIYMNI